MQSLHLFGSAVAGGLKPHSDIDLLVTVDAPQASPLRRALMTDLLSVSACVRHLKADIGRNLPAGS